MEFSNPCPFIFQSVLFLEKRGTEMINPVISRINRFRNLPNQYGNMIDNLEKGIVALLVAPVAVVTLGAYPKLNERVKQSNALAHILPILFNETVKMVNPYAEMKVLKVDHAFFAGKISGSIFEAANKNGECLFFIRREIVSRGLFLVGILVNTVCKVADLALGFLAASLSLILMGAWSSLNRRASLQLECLDFIHDILAGAILVVNPHANFSS